MDEETPDQRRVRIQREFDESMTMIVDCWPRMWRTLYCNCVREGFSENEAMQLVKTYILPMGGLK